MPGRLAARVSRQAQIVVAIVGVVVALVALLVDNVLARPADDPADFGKFVILGLLCVAVAAVIFFVVLPAAERSDEPAERLSQAALGSSLLSLVALIFFWTGLPFVLGAGGVVQGRLGEDRAAGRMEQSDGTERRDEAQAEASEEADPTAGERASQGWVAAVMGAMVFLACLIAFVIDQVI